MKKSLMATLIAVPLLTLSATAFAAEPESQEPLLLTATQMDDVTAGRRIASAGLNTKAITQILRLSVRQINISPVIIIQIGNNNSAVVYSGNFASFFQRR